MTDHKPNNNFFAGISISQTLIMLATTCLVFGSVGAIFYKVYRSSKHSSAPINDTIVEVHNKFDKPVIATSVSDSLLAVKLNNLYTEYCIKDTVPKKVPAYLEEAFMGYEFNDYIYFQKLDLTAIPETIKSDSLNYQTINELGNYYKGISLLMLNDTQGAIVYLNWVTNNSASNVYVTKAQWYLAMAYLKMNQPVKSIDLLSLLKENIVFKNSASNILLHLKPLVKDR